MDALITVRDAFHTRDFKVPSNVLRFYFMLESPIFSHAILSRTNDLMATFYRGSDVNTPYGKWVYHDPAVRFKDQGTSLSTIYATLILIHANAFPLTSSKHSWATFALYLKKTPIYTYTYLAMQNVHLPHYVIDI